MEKKRSQRGNRPIMLMVLDADAIENPAERSRALSVLASILPGTLRMTDVKGWYEKDASLGVLLTEMGTTDPRIVRQKVMRKISSAIVQSGSASWNGPVHVTTSIFCDGDEPLVETEALQPASAEPLEGPQAAPAGPMSSTRFPLVEQIALFMLDSVCIFSSLLLIAWSHSWSDPQPVGFQVAELSVSFLVIITVTVAFRFYRTERLLMEGRGILRVAAATLMVAALTVLCTFFPFGLFTSSWLLLGQTLIVWLISLSWKAIYAVHRFRSQNAKALWMGHRNIF